MSPQRTNKDQTDLILLFADNNLGSAHEPFGVDYFSHLRSIENHESINMKLLYE